MVSEVDERRARGLDERGRAADEDPVRHEQPHRPAVLGFERLAAVVERKPCLAARDVLEREVRLVAAVAVIWKFQSRSSVCGVGPADSTGSRHEVLTGRDPLGLLGIDGPAAANPRLTMLMRAPRA